MTQGRPRTPGRKTKRLTRPANIRYCGGCGREAAPPSLFPPAGAEPEKVDDESWSSATRRRPSKQPQQEPDSERKDAARKQSNAHRAFEPPPPPTARCVAFVSAPGRKAGRRESANTSGNGPTLALSGGGVKCGRAPQEAAINRALPHTLTSCKAACADRGARALHDVQPRPAPVRLGRARNPPPKHDKLLIRTQRHGGSREA